MVTSRQRMIETTLRLLRRQGFSATGMNQIVEESGAPRGSIYHHFPGGKEQLAVEALRTAGRLVVARLRERLDSEQDLGDAIRSFADTFASEFAESGYQRGCPVGNAAMDACATSGTIREVCEEIFTEWQSLLAVRIARAGYSKEEATSLAEFIVSSLEGALILCRARQSAEPLQRVAERVAALLAIGPKPKSRA